MRIAIDEVMITTTSTVLFVVFFPVKSLALSQQRYVADNRNFGDGGRLMLMLKTMHDLGVNALDVEFPHLPMG